MTIELVDPFTKGEWRFWINLNALKPTDEEEKQLDRICNQIDKIISRGIQPVEKHRELADLPGINAIQYSQKVDDRKYGTVVYIVDFADDVHG